MEEEASVARRSAGSGLDRRAPRGRPAVVASLRSALIERPFDSRGAIEIQRAAAALVVRRDRTGRVLRIAGADVSFDGDRGRAAVVVCDARTFEPIEVRTAEGRASAPYVPGLLAFREAPLVLEAFSRLRTKPDLILVDGMGRIHPRRFGIACHLGLVLDLPAVGCGKTPFVGTWREPGKRRGSWSEVSDGRERLGAAVRTREGAKPVFVSTGHRVSLRTAIRWAVRAATVARIPEPIRLAHRAASLARETARPG